MKKGKELRFLRYPGGKGKQVDFLEQYLPKIKGRYVEPFVGGGALFLHLQPEEALLADLNKELIELYRGVKNYPHKVWETFKLFPAGKIAYYKIRNRKVENKPLYYRAARTLYLNRTCFKGMWRHNTQGNFNVGYGGEDRRWSITHEKIVKLSKILKRAVIGKLDFEDTLNQSANGDFIFLDPPYQPGRREMKQAHYINGSFSFEEQVRLARSLKKVSKNVKTKWMMTNSSHPDIVGLYKDFYVIKIPKGTGHRIGIFSENPGEVLISNYKIYEKVS